MSALTNLFTSIANSIRAKDGTASAINAEDFPDRISDITTLDEAPDCEAIADSILGVSSPHTELQYITFTGTQYLNTLCRLWDNVHSNYDWTIEIKFSLSTLYNYNHFFSVNDLDTDNETWADSTGKYYIRIGGISKTQVGTFATSTEYVLKHVKTTDLKTYVNNTLTNTSNKPSSYSTYDLRFGHRDTSWFKGNLYYLKLYSNNVLIRDLIPVQKNDNNLVCFYDNVTDNYFVNSGTGDFVAGPEVGEEE